MAEPLSLKATLSLQFASRAASELGHDWVGTEHLLLGLCRVADDDDAVAAHVLREHAVTPQVLVEATMATLTRSRAGSTAIGYTAPALTPRSRYVLSRAKSLASELKSANTGTGHILLALVAEEDGVASSVLERAGLSLTTLYSAVSEAEDLEGGPGFAQSLPSSDAALRIGDLALQFAEEGNEGRVGTNHILLALLTEPRGAAAKVLSESRADITTLLRRLRQVRDEY